MFVSAYRHFWRFSRGVYDWIDDLRRGYLPDHLLASFGPDRMMWGSDWPVLERVGAYAQWFACVEQMTAGCDEGGRGAILDGMAARFLGLAPL